MCASSHKPLQLLDSMIESEGESVSEGSNFGHDFHQHFCIEGDCEHLTESDRYAC